MGFRFPKNPLFAYLGKDDVPVFCSRRKASKWWQSDGNRRRSQIRHDELGGGIISTSFQLGMGEHEVAFLDSGGQNLPEVIFDVFGSSPVDWILHYFPFTTHRNFFEFLKPRLPQ